MEKIQRSVMIDAPVERVYGYLTEPGHLPGIWPSMVEVHNTRVAAEGAHHFDWTYKMAGVRFHGHADTVEARQNALRVDRNEGGIPSTFRWQFAERGGATEVSLQVEYELPTFGMLLAPIVKLANLHENRDAAAEPQEEGREAGGVSGRRGARGRPTRGTSCQDIRPRRPERTRQAPAAPGGAHQVLFGFYRVSLLTFT
ncbi:MAG: SRPBCC family protein, partial [Anaeromyxobacter sp.]